MYKDVELTIEKCGSIPICSEREKLLRPLIDYIQNKVADKHAIRLNFICTHNSRRSHLAQIWAQTMANYFQLKQVHCYSGGTAETEIYPVVLQTLSNKGFKVGLLSEKENPIYSIKFDANEQSIIGFSKTFDHQFNPESEFAAIMTCSQADGDCPFIAGAEKRIALTYEDPKVYDETPLQDQKYAERSWQIASEMFYVFSNIKLS